MTPLVKRLPRELKHNLGKYLGIFLLMFAAVAVTSGFLLAAHSITVIMGSMRETYAIEDGRFTTAFKATDEQLDAAADAAADTSKMTIYENFSIDAAFTCKGDAADATKRTVRTYAHRTQVDLAAYAEGTQPATANEVAIDRVFAANNGVAVGDTICLEGRDYTVCGILTLPDYTALFPNNSDFTVNTLTFGVAEMTQAGFDALQDAGGAVTYNYSFSFADRDLTTAQRTQADKDIAKALSEKGANVTELLDYESNQGISYATNDVDGDSAMWEVLLDIIVLIMAFIFVVLIAGTIEEESAIIGTLLASGYRRRELVLHYLALPTLIGLVAAAGGTACGIVFFTQPMRDLYYGSYSLPPFYVSWDWGVFAQTTVIPFAVLVATTLLGLLRKIGKSPLQFLRHEASGKKGTKRGVTLPQGLGFVARFRLRVFLRNLGNFATLFVGIAFASLLLLFGLGILPTMVNYGEQLGSSLPANHLYTLKAPLELEGTDVQRDGWSAIARLREVDTDDLDPADALDLAMKVAALDVDLDNEDIHPVNTTDNGAEKIAQAEKFAVYTLEYDRGEGNGSETLTVYGVDPSSRYWKDLGAGDGRVVVGAGLADKYGFAKGAKIDLYDKYNNKTYTVTYEGTGATWGTETNVNVYLALDDFNKMFGNDADYFNGYVSDEALDLDANYLAGETTPSDMKAIGDQFVNMMEGLVGMMVGMSVFIYLIFMYLLTKAIIDRSARSISYMKVFGYRDREISALYIRSMTICVVISLVACMPLIIGSLGAIFKAMLTSYSGNIKIFVPNECLVESLLCGIGTYAVVALIHTRTIKRVSLAEALKVQE